MTTNEETFLLHVSFRGKIHDLSLPSDVPLSELHDTIEEVTSVPSSVQKLLFKGKKISKDSIGLTVKDAGLRDGMKVQLVGSTPGEMNELERAEMEKERRDRIMVKREAKAKAKASTKIRSTRTGKINTYIFHSISPHPTLPSPHISLSLLNRLASDPSILHIMSLHRFSIGLLTELAPHEYPNLLGLNENKGEVIKLRVRTDRYDGVRRYGDVRRVLCHELAHCVWGEHDNNFKELNSLLNRQVASYEATVKESSHTLSSYTGPSYSQSTSTTDPSLEVEAFAQRHRLGSLVDTVTVGLGVSEGREEDERAVRRGRVLAATLRRLEKEEMDIEEMCGSGTL